MKRRLLLLFVTWLAFQGACQAQNWQASQGYTPPGLAAPSQGMVPGMAMAPAGMTQAMTPGLAAPGMAMAAPGLAPPGIAPGMAAPGMTTPAGVAAGMSNFPNAAVQSSMGMVPKFDPSFFQKLQASRVQSGTVLTGILENNISSDKSKPGDIFSIRLEDGYNVNGNQLIPAQAKILGSISAVVSSRSVRGGSPGSVQISLQTLVFPDGRTCPFFGFVEHNTNLDANSMSPSDPLKTGQKYAQRSAYYMANFFTTRVGFPVHPANFGHEFKMTKGEVLPIRLNRNIDVTHMTPPVASPTVTTPAQTYSPYGAPQGMPPGAPAQPVGLSAGKMGSLSPMQSPPPAPAAGLETPSYQGYTKAPPTTGAAASGYVPGLAEPF